VNHQKALRALSDLDSDEVATIHGSLVALREPAHRDQLHGAFEKTLDDPDTAGSLVEALLAMEVLRSSHGFEYGDIASAIATADDMEVDDHKRGPLESALKELLPIHQLARAAKAYDLSTAYERQFHISRVLTDIRPIFDEQISTKPVGALVVHQLELRGYVNGRLRSSYWAMSNDDLSKLRDQIDRAINKSTVLSELLSGDEVPVHHPEKEL
jgi:hypothetical protein